MCYSIAENSTEQETVEENCDRVLQKIALCKRLWNRTVLSIAANCTEQETVVQNCVKVLQQIALCKRLWNRTVLQYCSKLHCASDCGTELC